MGQLISLQQIEASRSVLLLLTCSDMRLHGPQDLNRRLATLLGGEGSGPLRKDVIAVPGANFGLSRGSVAERGLMLEYIGILVDKHQPETIVIVPHLGCARYAETLRPSSEEEETAVIAGDLRASAHLLRDVFRNLAVVTAIAQVDETRTTRIDLVTDDELVRLSVPPSSAPARERP